MPQTETWTVGRLLEWTSGYLKERGAESPRLDAEVLLAEARQCRRIDLYTTFDEIPAEEVRTAFRELVRRRAEGTPVAYLVGRREFYSLPFRVTPDVLIPRPETEFLVVALLDLAKSAGNETCRICDVGTGSGIIAICAAVHLPKCQVTAIDISPAAIDVATENARTHGVDQRIEFVSGDLLADLPADREFDIVASNPPYVSTSELEQLASDVADHEPHLALAAGPRGTDVIERLIPQAAERLRPGGHLLLEISPMIETAVRDLVTADGRFELRATIKDLAGLARVVSAQRKA